MQSPFGNPGQVNFNAFYGGVSGATKGEISALGPSRRGAHVPSQAAGSAGSLLTLPVMIALGVLIWYAVKTYE